MFVGRENKISAEHLQAGETITIIGFGQSMTPILKSGQPAIVVPVTADIKLAKNNIVFCKVAGHYYLHKITAIRNGNTYQISNNHGHSNGWCSRKCIYGLMTEKL
ncbi:MAG: 2-oxo acid dehydrogenase subunit E2 [Selenomonadaceae bacterium]|nr:2-oxo acid dehydrogenase subunit E2 [Selenomonadaceae bacterium]